MNFQQSQITPEEFEQLAKLLLKYPKVNATSEFDVGKVNSPLRLPLKLDAVFKKQRASKVPIHLQDKDNRLLEILEQYEIISPVNKEEQPKGITFINPVIILAKGESLKILNKKAITCLDDVLMQSQTKDEMFIVLEKYHQKLLPENMKAAPDKSHFFLT